MKKVTKTAEELFYEDVKKYNAVPLEYHAHNRTKEEQNNLPDQVYYTYNLKEHRCVIFYIMGGYFWKAENANNFFNVEDSNVSICGFELGRWCVHNQVEVSAKNLANIFCNEPDRLGIEVFLEWMIDTTEFLSDGLSHFDYSHYEDEYVEIVPFTEDETYLNAIAERTGMIAMIESVKKGIKEKLIACITDLFNCGFRWTKGDELLMFDDDAYPMGYAELTLVNDEIVLSTSDDGEHKLSELSFTMLFVIFKEMEYEEESN